MESSEFAFNQRVDHLEVNQNHSTHQSSSRHNGVAKKCIRISSYFRWKYVIERILAVPLLLAALPIITVLYVLIRVTSIGPGFYRQRRVGQRGRTFILYKLRSMRCDAERDSGPTWAKLDDPRATMLGRWLRRTHLDELPQLFNVMRGEMTLVGPRPERPNFVVDLSNKFCRYHQRHEVRPGITGMAQIYLPADENEDSVRKKLAFDLEYIRSATFGLDLRIWVCTALHLLGLRRGLAPKIVGLDRQVDRFRDGIRENQLDAAARRGNRRQQKRKALRRQKRQKAIAIAPLSDSSLELLLDPPSRRTRHVRLRIQRPK